MDLVLELGSGNAPTFIEGARVIHLDRVEAPHVELVCDLNHGLPLPANVFDAVIAHDVLEHLDDTVFSMDEIHRVLKPNGVARIKVPIAGSRNHLTDPTHRRGYTRWSFDFFDDRTILGRDAGRVYTQRRWRIERRATLRSNLSVVMVALKPGEQARVVPDLFGMSGVEAPRPAPGKPTRRRRR